MHSLSVTLRMFATRYYLKDNPHFSQNYRRTVTYTLNRWERTTDNPPVQAVRSSDLLQFRAACGELKPRSVNSYLKVLRAILRHAQLHGLIVQVPSCKALPVHHEYQPTPSVEEVSAMYAAAPHAGLTWPRCEPPARFWRRWLVVSYFTALRLDDLLHLRIDSIRDGLVRIKVRKTGHEQVMPCCDITWQHWLTAPAGDLVFPCSKSGAPRIRRELRRLSRAVDGGVTVTPHGLRRLAISEYAKVSEAASRLLHGSGVGVMRHYWKAADILWDARRKLAVPEAFRREGRDDQLRLF